VTQLCVASRAQARSGARHFIDLQIGTIFVLRHGTKRIAPTDAALAAFRDW
jgi:hypothetical protein